MTRAMQVGEGLAAVPSSAHPSTRDGKLVRDADASHRTWPTATHTHPHLPRHRTVLTDLPSHVHTPDPCSDPGTGLARAGATTFVAYHDVITRAGTTRFCYRRARAAVPRRLARSRTRFYPSITHRSGGLLQLDSLSVLYPRRLPLPSPWDTPPTATSWAQTGQDDGLESRCVSAM